MMEATVTMSLDTFKELESKAKVLDLMNSNERFLIFRSCYGDYHVSMGDEANVNLIKDLAQAIQSRDAMILEMRGYTPRGLFRKS